MHLHWGMAVASLRRHLLPDFRREVFHTGGLGAVLLGIATGLVYFAPPIAAGLDRLLQSGVTSSISFALFMVFFITAPVAAAMVSTALVYSGLRLRSALGPIAGIAGILYSILIVSGGCGQNFITAFGRSSLSLAALLFPLLTAAFFLKERPTFGKWGIATGIAFLAYAGISQLRVSEAQFVGAFSYFLLAASLVRSPPTSP